MALLLGGCAGTRLERAPSTPPPFTGAWVFEPARSDDVVKLIKDAQPIPKKPRVTSDDDSISADGRGSANRGGGMGGGRGGRSGSRGDDNRASSSSQSYEPLPAAYGKLKPSDFIKAFVMPADRLEIRLSNDQIVLQQDSRVRTLLAGDEQPYSVSDRYGSRAVTAGFSGQKLMVLSQDKQRLSVQESFEINSQGLLETIKFEARGLKSITAHFWYRRAKAEDQVIPNEGPPQPGAR